MDASEPRHSVSRSLRRRFKWRLLIPVLGALVMGIVIASRAELLWRVRELILRRAAETAEISTHALALELHDAIDDAEQRLLGELLSWPPGGLPAATPNPRQRHDTPAKGEDASSAIPGVLVFDEAGRLVRGVSTLDPSAAAAIGRGARVAERSGPGNEPHVFDVSSQGGAGPSLLAVSIRVVGANGVPRGFVAAAVDPRIVLLHHRLAKPSGSSALLIVSRDGRTLARWPEPSGARAAPTATAPLAHGLSEPGPAPATEVLRWSDGVDRITSHWSIKGQPLIVVTGIDRDAMLEPWRQDVVRVSILLPVALLLGGFLIWLALRQLRLRDDVALALAQSERGMRGLVDGSIQGLLVHRGGKPVFANHRAAEISGYASAAELTALDSLDRIVAPQELERMHRIRNARSAGQPAPEVYEFRGMRKDGTSFWAETRVSAIEWEGQPATLATLFDVTQRHRAEEDLRASQRLLQTVIDAIPHAVWVKDLEHRYRIVNPAMAQRWDARAEDMIGQQTPRPEYRQGPEFPRVLAQEREVLSTGKPAEWLLDATLPDGSPRKIRQIRAPLRDVSGQIIGLVGVGEDVTERYAAENRLEAQQQLMDLMINSLPHSIWVKDLEGRFLLVNEANARINGLTREQIIGKKLTELPLAPGWPLDRLADLDRQLAERLVPVESGDVAITLADGTRRIRRQLNVPLLDGEGRLTGIVGISEDVTQHREAELALRASERRFKDFSEASSDWFWEMGADLRYTSLTGGLFEANIYDPAMVIGKTALEVPWPPEDHAVRKELMTLMQSHRPVRNAILKLIGRDGAIKTIRYSGVPVFGTAGEFLGYRGTGTDISQEMEARRHADLAHMRLSDAIEALPAGLMLWDSQDRLVLWNSRVSEILPLMVNLLRPGVDYREFAARALDGVAEETVGDREEWIRKRIAAFRDPTGSQLLRLKTGRWIRLYERKTSEGGTVSLRFDVTEFQQQEAELRQAQKMEALGQLTGGVAHDFNNLAQVILGYAALGLRAVGQQGPVGEYLAHIRTAGQRAADLTQHMLAFSRQKMLQPVALNLNEVIAAQAQMLEPTLGERIRLVARPHSGLHDVVADRGLLEQVVMNLVLNARDAMPQGGTILLSTENAEVDVEFCRQNEWARPGRYALLRCADTGVGMTSEVRRRLFEPFFTTKEPGKGTGLGLAMAYGIVRQHDGMVFVESEEGQGTTLTIYLPAA